MKFLVDQNISFRIIKALQTTFEIEHINDLTLKDKSDKEIWEFAKTNEYCIVTFDGDFMIFLWFGVIHLKLFGLEPIIKQLKMLLH